ncbi:spore germination protein [Paenibacillus sp. J22TS3]|uniref:spore germination protein n=1 Tax=Paenibacillus sp. J22TS3 TaxID=2807192 RepID=UPI001B12F173|nr:spore germination protein [Paenibacillus sp. J22TS3]GIP23751.1 spore germination protein [Paenibacillus sp. J22TS3]
MDTEGTQLEQINELLAAIEDVNKMSFVIHGHTCVLIYIESIINMQTLHQRIADVLIKEAAASESSEDNIVSMLNKGMLIPMPSTVAKSAEDAVDHLVRGEVLLYLSESDKIFMFNLVKYKKRAVSESKNELVVIGPQEAFIEDINSNLSLLRHKIKHPDLKTIRYEAGKYTKTVIYIVYIEGLCEPEIVRDLDQEMRNMDLDGVLGISYTAEQTKKGNRTPFPQFQYTERPDSVAASLLEGRVGILQDGTPSALLVPVTFFSLMQSSEDYYQSFMSASWIRMVRLLFAVISMLLPSLYVAITTFQPEMIPTDLLLTFAAARENIPFSALTEALIMELTFEGLREAGTRIPKPVGQTISIIGAIVIGQAAVQAGIVSTPMVIVVSITGIASYIIPHYELGLALRLLRFPLLILGGTTGLIGVFIGTFVVFGHLVNLKSFGTPYMQPVAPLILKDWKDVFVRVPSPIMKSRSSAYTSRNPRRQNSK